jgi:hypothetical protein
VHQLVADRVEDLAVGLGQCPAIVWSEKTTPNPNVSSGRLRSTTVT